MLKNNQVFRSEYADISNARSVGKCGNGFLFIKKKNIAYRVACLLIIDENVLRENILQKKKKKD